MLYGPSSHTTAPAMHLAQTLAMNRVSSVRQPDLGGCARHGRRCLVAPHENVRRRAGGAFCVRHAKYVSPRILTVAAVCASLVGTSCGVKEGLWPGGWTGSISSHARAK